MGDHLLWGLPGNRHLVLAGRILGRFQAEQRGRLLAEFISEIDSQKGSPPVQTAISSPDRRTRASPIFHVTSLTTSAFLSLTAGLVTGSEIAR